MMKIYFVETADYNTLVAVENGRAKTISAPDGIDLEQRDAEGTVQTNNIVFRLKQYFSAEPLNDYCDIYSSNEFDWNAADFDRVTRVY